MTPVGWILEIQKKERERMITSKDINDALEHLNILVAQIGSHNIRKLHKKPLEDFIKKVNEALING